MSETELKRYRSNVMGFRKEEREVITTNLRKYTKSVLMDEQSGWVEYTAAPTMAAAVIALLRNRFNIHLYSFSPMSDEAATASTSHARG